MSGNLTQFGEDLRHHLSRLQTSLSNINGLFAGNTATNDAELVGQVQELRATIDEFFDRAVALRETLQAGFERDGALTAETMSRWIATRQAARLHARADLIEQMATTAMELAALDALQAERFAMTAIVTRRQAVAVQIQRVGHPDFPVGGNY